MKTDPAFNSAVPPAEGLNCPGDLNCEQFEAAIQEQLDLRLPLDENGALLEHAVACEPCAQLLNDYVAIEMGLSQLSPNLGSTRSERFSHSNDRAFRSPEPTRIGQFLPSLVTAAMLLIAIGWYSLAQFAMPQTSHSTSVAELSNHVDRASVHHPVLLTTEANAKSLSNVSATDAAANAALLARKMESAAMLRYFRPEPNQIRLFHGTNLIQLPMPNPANSESTNLTGIISLNQIVSLSQIPATVSWNRIAGGLNPLQPYLKYSAELPGLAPLTSPLNMTLELLQRTLVPSAKPTAEPIPNLQGNRLDNKLGQSIV
jgi:hypothetical protein